MAFVGPAARRAGNRIKANPRAAAVLHALPPWAWAWLAAANLVGFVVAVFDKRRARRGGGRVPEAALLALALLGGWAGEALAFLAVHHKTRKPRFLVPFALCALANAAALAYAAGVRPG